MSSTELLVSAALPDVAAVPTLALQGTLNWVGMRGIEAPVLVNTGTGSRQLAARIDAEVNLIDPQARGIHMSRLYLSVDRLLAAEVLSPALLRQLLEEFLESHRALSSAARLRLSFELLLRRAALSSELSGWRSYPMQLQASLQGDQLQLELGFRVLYSSTCPCSAALARQLIQQQFVSDFGATGAVDAAVVLSWLGSEQGIVATPHSQRSALDIRLTLDPGLIDLPFADWIDRAEEAMQTPVQTAVRRIDEQAFALRNGQNLMFCEDAARRIHRALHSDMRLRDFEVQVSHFESLHAHDAVAVVSKWGGRG